ncbi:MAG TPA: ABC-type transport auxiliary lipoprotein family protein [Dokdonella sp.]|nr:ABC-type transport auxiliary lipoprotein family protein [Dokdonella sp.]
MNRNLRLLVVAASLLLGACAALSGKHGSFAVYAPRLDAAVPHATQAPIDWQLLIDTPRASTALDTNHIAVMPGPDLIEVYPEARWRDPAPSMLRSLIVQGFDQDGRIRGVSALESGLNGDYSLVFELRDFQIEITDGSARAAIRLTVKLFDRRSNRIVASRTFAEEAPAAGTDVASAVVAFGAAINHLVPQLVDWTVDAGEANEHSRATGAKP